MIWSIGRTVGFLFGSQQACYLILGPSKQGITNHGSSLPRVPPQNRRMGAYVTVGAAYFPGVGRLFYQRGVGSSKIGGKSEKCGLSKVLC